MAGIFSRIGSGEIPSYKVVENDLFFAFLDINPLAVGHTLVLPKKEVDYIFNVDDELYKGLFLFAKQVAFALESCVACKRIGIAVVGLEVPHAHIHLVPLNNIYDIDFSKPKLKLSCEELSKLAGDISAELTGEWADHLFRISATSNKLLYHCSPNFLIRASLR